MSELIKASGRADVSSSRRCHVSSADDDRALDTAAFASDNISLQLAATLLGRNTAYLKRHYRHFEGKVDQGTFSFSRATIEKFAAEMPSKEDYVRLNTPYNQFAPSRPELIKRYGHENVREWGGALYVKREAYKSYKALLVKGRKPIELGSLDDDMGEKL